MRERSGGRHTRSGRSWRCHGPLPPGPRGPSHLVALWGEASRTCPHGHPGVKDRTFSPSHPPLLLPGHPCPPQCHHGLCGRAACARVCAYPLVLAPGPPPVAWGWRYSVRGRPGGRHTRSGRSRRCHAPPPPGSRGPFHTVACGVRPHAPAPMSTRVFRTALVPSSSLATPVLCTMCRVACGVCVRACVTWWRRVQASPPGCHNQPSQTTPAPTLQPCLSAASCPPDGK